MTIEQRISITAIVITWVIVWLIARAEQKKAGSTPARLPRLGTTGAWFDSTIRSGEQRAPLARRLTTRRNPRQGLWLIAKVQERKQ